MDNNITLDIDLMGKKARIIGKNGKEYTCIIDEVIEGDNSDRDGVPFAFLDNNTFIYADEIESIEILDD